MRARRSRSQHALRWERGRPARHANRARKKTYPFKNLKGGGRYFTLQVETPMSL